MKPAEAAPCPNRFEPAVGRSQASPLELPLAPKWDSERQPALEVSAGGGGAPARPGAGNADGGGDGRPLLGVQTLLCVPADSPEPRAEPQVTAFCFCTFWLHL